MWRGALGELPLGSVAPKHAHVHEQITFVVSGCLRMDIDGGTCELVRHSILQTSRAEPNMVPTP